MEHYLDTGTAGYYRCTCGETFTTVEAFTAHQQQRTFYVLSPAHVTFYKYAVRAPDIEAAKALFADKGDTSGDVAYVGFIDADWEGGPEDEWSLDDSYVEGTG